MFKLVVLSVLVAVAAAKPSFIHSPIVAAPITKIVQPAPLLVHSNEHVGSVVNHVPTSVSAQSSSVVHSTGVIEKTHITPIQKTVIVPAVQQTYFAQPIVESYHAPALIPAPLSYASSHAYTAPVLGHSSYDLGHSHAYAPTAYNAPLW